jgi:hypothetical protein
MPGRHSDETVQRAATLLVIAKVARLLEVDEKTIDRWKTPPALQNYLIRFESFAFQLIRGKHRSYLSTFGLQVLASAP